MAPYTRNSLRRELAGLRRKSGKLAAVLALAAAVVAGPVMPTAYATDLAGTGTAQGARFVRIGLNKSVVIRLPAEARDVLIGNPEIVDAVIRTKNTAYLFARGVGQTNIFFFDASGQQILALDLEVAQDMAALQKLIQRTLPGTRITVDTIGDNVVLGGIAATPSEAKTAYDLALKFAGSDEKKVMTTVNVTGKEQVMLRVRIAEVQRNVLKQFGVNAQALFSVGKFGFNLSNINPFTANTTGLLSQNGGYAGSYSNGSTQIDAVIRAMERDGLLRTLAEPTLTAISGESAKFLAGGEYPIPVSDDNGQISVEFKPFGVGLGFTPIVMSEGRISLKINTEVSEISSENAVSFANGSGSIPALNVRRAETTVELPSGGSMAMAGLIRDITKQDINGTPGLKNLPVLGALFRSRDFVQNQSELVVIVTPFVVEPVNERQLASPLDGLNVATDRQTILFGRLNKVYGAPGQQPGGVYHGNVGYIVE
ncbi:type II and III secretion system protein family protein [soil metagenome]